MNEITVTGVLADAHAIELQGVDLVATGVVVDPLAVGVVDHHARRLLQHLREGGEVLVLQALLECKRDPAAANKMIAAA